MGENLSPKLRFGLWYDFRNPPAWHRPSTQLYCETLEQIAWADQHGFDDVWLSEHHFLDDGYASSLLPIAAAIAARTTTISIGTGPLTGFYEQYVTALKTLGKPTTNLQLAGGFFWLIP